MQAWPPQREGEPSNDQDDGELAEVGIAAEEGLLALAVLPDLNGIVPEHDEGQAEAEAIPSVAQGISGEHGGSSTKQNGHRQQWHHEAAIARNTSACQHHELQPGFFVTLLRLPWFGYLLRIYSKQQRFPY